MLVTRRRFQPMSALPPKADIRSDLAHVCFVPGARRGGAAAGRLVIDGSASTFRHATSGGLAGGQIGYNWQVGPSWVLGFEVDEQWSGQRDTATLFGCGNTNAGMFGAGGTGFNTCLADQQKLENFGTARARVGYATGDFLLYATGGGAWGTVKDNLAFSSVTVVANPLFPGGVSCASAGSFSHTLTGWIVGGGAEMKLWSSNWSAKVEYLYVDLGSYTDSVTQPVAAPTGSFTYTSTSHFRDNIVRAGLNYRFGY